MADREFVKNVGGARIYYVPKAKVYVRCVLDARGNECTDEVKKTLRDLCPGEDQGVPPGYMAKK